MNTDGKTHKAIRELILAGHQINADEVTIKRAWLPDIISILKKFGDEKDSELVEKLEALIGNCVMNTDGKYQPMPARRLTNRDK